MIRMHFFGGLGDVCLTRKYSALFKTDLKNHFTVASIFDLYDLGKKNGGVDRDKIVERLDYIKRERLKDPSKFISDLENLLIEKLVSGEIRYFRLDDSPLRLNGCLVNNYFSGKNNVFDVSVPNNLHVCFAKKLVNEHNGHIMVEKPISGRLWEVDAFSNFLDGLSLDGRVLMDAEHYSHYPNMREYIFNFERYSRDDIPEGHGLGKIKGINIHIEEEETFSNKRNQEIIEIAKSGGGIWLDTGIHAAAFLRHIGANIDYDSIEIKMYKSHDPNIWDNKYGETAAEIGFNVYGRGNRKEYFNEGCRVGISIGKCCAENKKMFAIEYEKGKIEIDILNKSLRFYREGSDESHITSKFTGDAFYYVFDDLRKCVLHNVAPITNVFGGIRNCRDVFITYGKNNAGIEKLKAKEHKFSMRP